jgi:ATP-binding cassette subfamily F protein uup
MGIIQGKVTPDSGFVQKDQGVKVASFIQKVPADISGNIFEIVTRNSGEQGELILEYFREEERLTSGETEDASLLCELREKLENDNGWAILGEIDKVLAQLALDKKWEFNNLSGGQKRRVLLASALVAKPEVLLLDEPTNHLDVETIAWLEDYLLRLNCTILFVTHDRTLLRKLANRIIELDRGKLYDWSCGYDTFLARKQEFLDAEQKAWERFDRKLAQEEVWIRKGIQARRTRNEGRVRALKKMREERKLRREQEGRAVLNISNAQKSGGLVIEAEGLTFGFDDNKIVEDFSCIIRRGDKIGVVGPNGCGKTTLIKLLLKKLVPERGLVEHGTNLDIVYYDQLRQQLDDSKNAWENILPTGDRVVIDGKEKHIISYLQDFLFTPDKAKAPITHLSGGERNRLLLAKLFAQPANLIVLDEPTNDLDIETLELLEELLANFKGSVLLICHDRAFLNNVATSTFVFAPDKQIKEIVGGYDEWLAQRKQEEVLKIKATESVSDKKEAPKNKIEKKKKLSFNEKKEFEALPDKIESLESEMETLHANMGDPEFYKDGEKVAQAKIRLEEIEDELEKAFERWEELESISN